MGYAATSQPQAHVEDFSRISVGPRARSPEREGAGSTVTAIGLHALSAENFRNSGAAKSSMTSPARGEGPRFVAELAKAELDGQDCAMRKIVRR
jgi:hypothetical protein